MKSSAIGARVPSELKDTVVRLAHISGQSVSTITEDALREYTGWRIPQFTDLREAIASADAGDFATDDEVAEFFAKHGA